MFPYLTKVTPARWRQTRPGTTLLLWNKERTDPRWPGVLHGFGTDMRDRECFILTDGPATVYVPFDAVGECWRESRPRWRHAA